MGEGIVLPMGSRTIALVVDDDADNRFFATNLLSAMGFECLEATNGAEALALLRGSGFPIRLMILDLMMPVENGYSVLAKLESWKWHPRVIVVSGFINQGQKEALRRADSILRKPLNMEAFMAIVKSGEVHHE